ncbi:cytochrome c-type biogenesis protein CcmH [Erwinia tracheiphila]|nr:cytochrome c-type biogenesis protein CcmH [Erwinia tracheiphila]UIA84735.1 cytochrome c-type biogenesis protein CcmH [Erwinia tracheiphila]UIA86936.1 cytochrome c-type biogenesis protein CcmH [Erwinia tracheiphila]UIA93327.1 cytochrome c-type biogenesis protein CcmH [Erwinia tracheiphila]
MSLLLAATKVLSETTYSSTFSAIAEQQYPYFTETLRCPECQYKSIADSGSFIAADMRLITFQSQMIRKKSDEINAQMVDSHCPDVVDRSSNLLLWAGPALFAFLGAALILLRARIRRLGQR